MMADSPYPVDSATRACCGGIGTHTRGCRGASAPDRDRGQALILPTDFARRLDAAVNLVDLARNDGNKILRELPRTAPLFAAVDLVCALGHLRQAALLLDGVADTLESVGGAR